MTGNETADGDIVTLIADVFERRGADAYLGEAVTMAEHMLQTATLAHHAGAAEPLVVAALLHDIGHFASAFGTYSADDTVDRLHHETGATLLDGHFPPLVVESVRLHVAAKRYLCATEPEYLDALSRPSRHSLELQGGPMTPAEIADFRHLPFHAEAVQVRRWDDGGKAPGTPTIAFDRFLPLLKRTVTGSASR